MKKKILCVLLTGLCMASFVACGKSEKEQAAEYYQDELGMSAEEAEMFADAFYEDGSTETSNSTAEEETEEVVKEFERYPADPSWSNYTIADNVFQIDDIMYITGGSLADMIETIDGSAVDYTYDYNPNEELHPKTSEELIVYREGQEWLTIEYYNYSEDWLKAGDAIVKSVHPSDTAYEYGYYFNGMSYQDILSLRDTDISEMFSEHRKEVSYTSYVLMYSVTNMIYADWSGYDFNNNVTYSFSYDPDTYYITGMKVSQKYYNVYAIDYDKPMHLVTDLEGVNIDELKEAVVTTYLEDYWNQSVYHNNSAECIGYILGSRSSIDGQRFHIILQGEDGSYYYVTVYLNDYRDGRIEIGETYVGAMHSESLEGLVDYLGSMDDFLPLE